MASAILHPATESMRDDATGQVEAGGAEGSGGRAVARLGRRRWFSLGWRVARLYVGQAAPTGDLVRASYDRIADGYDEAWTHHMRTLSLDMLDRLDPPSGATGIDLTCGTGFVTEALVRRCGGPVTGVDASSGMLACARDRGAEGCRFVEADAVGYLRSCPSGSADVVTCAWGLGYTRPWRVMREAARVLRPGGCFGVIDNSLFSLAGVLWASALTFAERPAALGHVMRVRFLPGPRSLAWMMRAAGLRVQTRWGGSKTYHVPDGQAAIARLQATGAAAGFEFAADEAEQKVIFDRFAAVLEERYRGDDGIPITHRYLAAVGRKR